MEESNFKMAKVFIKIALPSILCTVISFFQQLISVIYAGHLNDERLVAAYGLANVLINCFLVSPIQGVNSAMETLGS